MHDTSSAGAGCSWAFAILWILFSIPMSLVALSRARNDPFFYLGLLFPIAGVFLIGFAAYQTLRRAKYGRSVCRIDRVPIPLARTFRADIEVALRELPEKGFDARLECVRVTVTGSGKQRRTHEQVVWQDEQNVRHGVMPGPNGLRVPLRFDLPHDAEPTDTTNPRDRVVWRLHVSAQVPGVDYDASFELPVFRTSEAGEESHPPPPPDPARWTPPPDIDLRFGEVTIRAARSLADWFGYVFFLTLWTGALVFFHRVGAPVVAVAVMAVIAALVVLNAIDYLLGRTVLTVARQALTIRRTWFGLGRRVTIPAAEIEILQSRTGAKVGKRTYHQVTARLRDGRTRTVAKYIRTRRDAEMLAAHLTAALM